MLSLIDRTTAIETPASPGSNPVLHLAGLRQTWSSRRGIPAEFVVQVDELIVERGAFVAIQGPNGCGKTTLLTVLALLRAPSNIADLGKFVMTVPGSKNGPDDTGSTGLSIDLKTCWKNRWLRRRIDRLRRRWIGFTPQQLELLTVLKVRETIAAPLWLNGVPIREIRSRVDELITAFGLDQGQIAHQRVGRVSGGQQQKTALARAIAHRPAVIFLDEPTAYLYHTDARSALRGLQQLQAESATSGHPVTIVMITHDRTLAADFATHLIEMDVRTAGNQRVGYITRSEQAVAHEIHP